MKQQGTGGYSIFLFFDFRPPYHARARGLAVAHSPLAKFVSGRQKSEVFFSLFVSSFPAGCKNRKSDLVFGIY
jgi:hypothetical protein